MYSYCRPKEQILNYATWQLRSDENEHCYTIEKGKQHGSGIVVKLSGIDTRTQAETMVRNEVWVPTEELLELADEEYYWFQLTGLSVVTVNGEALGNVVRLMETGANDVLVVSSESDSKEVLIPYIQNDVVKSIDLSKKLITVDWHPDYI